MRNRAKCKLCNSIIESLHRNDYVSCKCGEISVDGGLDYCRASAIDFKNFLRIDDEENEIVVKFKEPEEKIVEEKTKPTRKELMDVLQEMISNIENLPSQAMQTPINHYDFCSSLILLQSILEVDCSNEI